MSTKHFGFWTDKDSLTADFIKQGYITSEEENQVGFNFLETQPGNNGYSPYDFLHGWCDIFARYLADNYGYTPEAIYNSDGELIHAYCVAHSCHGLIFIDIRGETNNYHEFLEEFEGWLPICACDAEYPIYGTTLLNNTSESQYINDGAKKAAKWIDEYYKYWD